MTYSTLPLSYCTNVHPGRTVAEVDHGLDQYTLPVSKHYGQPLAAGLWLANSVVREMLEVPELLPKFVERLRQRNLTCYTLNTFPFGDFHSERVKENVYIPDWTEQRRLQYTCDCARILAEMLPHDTEGSLSTVPLGFKELPHAGDFIEQTIVNLLELATRLDRIYQETGKRIRLAIEPEPLCILETTAETLSFFDQLNQRVAERHLRDVVHEYIGVCYDVCHQSVEFEDVTESIESLCRAGIRINKIHITCALQIDNPAENEEARNALARYVEPRYLHQTIARMTSGEIHRFLDLDRDFALSPQPPFRDAETWRIHFHVPVNAESLGPLQTTRADLRRALKAVGKLDYAPHLEVETYTWEVLPDGAAAKLVDGLTAELTATRSLLEDLQSDSPTTDRNVTTA